MIQQQSRLRRPLWMAGMAIVAALSASAAFARGSIESVSGFMQGGSEVLRIDFSEPQTELPTGFAVQTPARIALDFPGVTNASGRSQVEINQGNVKSAHIVEAGERSRIVLNLKQATTYRAELQGKTVLVLLDAVTGGARVPAGPAPVFAEGHNANVLPLKDLDFRRGTDGAGRIDGVLDHGSECGKPAGHRQRNAQARQESFDPVRFIPKLGEVAANRVEGRAGLVDGGNQQLGTILSHDGFIFLKS